MKLCHVCNMECEDFAELCPICGADLTETGKKQNDIILNKPCLVATFDDVVSAEIFKDILKENDIVYAGNEESPEATMRVTFGGGFTAEEIYVDSEDYEKAFELYEEFQNSEVDYETDFFGDDFFIDEEVEEEQSED